MTRWLAFELLMTDPDFGPRFGALNYTAKGYITYVLHKHRTDSFQEFAIVVRDLERDLRAAGGVPGWHTICEILSWVNAKAFKHETR
jgi:hypothetical protein